MKWDNYMKKPTLNIERLKSKREEKGWNKLEASEKMGIPQYAYGRYENGQIAPSYSGLKDMALTLGTSVEYLTNQTDDDRPLEYLISVEDERLMYIIDTYKDAPENNRERLFRYAEKLSSN